MNNEQLGCKHPHDHHSHQSNTVVQITSFDLPDPYFLTCIPRPHTACLPLTENGRLTWTLADLGVVVRCLDRCADAEPNKFRGNVIPLPSRTWVPSFPLRSRPWKPRDWFYRNQYFFGNCTSRPRLVSSLARCMRSVTGCRRLGLGGLQFASPTPILIRKCGEYCGV